MNESNMLQLHTRILRAYIQTIHQTDLAIRDRHKLENIF